MGYFEETKFIDKANREIIIRTATKADTSEVLHMAREIINTEPYLLTTPEEFKLTTEQEQAWIESTQQNPNNLILIALHNDQVIGSLDFHCGHRRRIEHTGSFGMSVRRTYQGSGIGGYLLQSLIKWALGNEKIEKINLEVFANNHQAIALYERNGFVQESLLKGQIKLSGEDYVDLIGMGLFLNK